MLISLQLTLIVPALPEIPELVGISANNASWLVTITLLTSTVCTPIVTRMADMYGRRLLLLVSLGLLAAGSVIAALSLAFPLLLLGRALQGFGAAIVPIGVSLMRDLLSPHRAATGIALMSGTMGIGSAVGLPLSGVLLQFGGLGSIFWVSALASAVFFILTARVVPPGPRPPGGRFDIAGALLFALALTATLLLISKGVEWSASPLTLGAAAGGLLAFAVWWPHQLRAREPLVDLRSSMRRAVLTTNVASFFVTMGMFANYLLTIQQARAPEVSDIGLGLPVVTAGLLILPSAVLTVALSPVAAKVLVTFGGRAGFMLGAAILAGTYAFRFFVHDSLPAVVLGATLVGLGTTFAFAAMPTLIMAAVPSHQAAAANGLNSLIRNLAGSVTTAAFGLLLVVAAWPADADYLSHAGLRTGFGVLAACALVALVIAATLPPHRRLTPGRGRRV